MIHNAYGYQLSHGLYGLEQCALGQVGQKKKPRKTINRTEPNQNVVFSVFGFCSLKFSARLGVRFHSQIGPKTSINRTVQACHQMQSPPQPRWLCPPPLPLPKAPTSSPHAPLARSSPQFPTLNPNRASANWSGGTSMREGWSDRASRRGWRHDGPCKIRDDGCSSQ